MSAATPGKLQRALAGCCSLIKGSKRTFNFKGLFLKDSACCKVAAIQNKTIFAGPNFAVSYSPAIPRTVGICTVQLIGNRTFYVLRKEQQFLFQICLNNIRLPPYFSPSPFSLLFIGRIWSCYFSSWKFHASEPWMSNIIPPKIVLPLCIQVHQVYFAAHLVW